MVVRNVKNLGIVLSLLTLSGMAWAEDDMDSLFVLEEERAAVSVNTPSSTGESVEASEVVSSVEEPMGGLEEEIDNSLPWLKNMQVDESEEVAESQAQEVVDPVLTEMLIAVEEHPQDTEEEKPEVTVELVTAQDMARRADILLPYVEGQEMLSPANKQQLAILFGNENSYNSVEIRAYVKAEGDEVRLVRHRLVEMLYNFRKYCVEQGKKAENIKLFVEVEGDITDNRIELFL